jgi:hypothetical protein
MDKRLVANAAIGGDENGRDTIDDNAQRAACRLNPSMSSQPGVEGRITLRN